MNAVKVDAAGRIRLDIFRPGEVYEPDIRSADEITLHRVSGARRRFASKAEALQAIEESPLRFSVTWEQLRAETRS